jgi:hypothetical protein
LVESAGSQVYAGELLDVFYEGVAMLISAREARKYENGGTGVPPESFN